MDQEVKDCERNQRQREWMKTILGFSSDENESDAETEDKTMMHYPLDTGQVIALRFPYPMLDDESEEDDSVVFSQSCINKKRKLSHSKKSIRSVESLNYKHKRRKRNCISDSEDTDQDCNKYLTTPSTSIHTESGHLKTENAISQSSFKISDKENGLSLKTPSRLHEVSNKMKISNDQNELDNKLKGRLKGRKSREVVDILENPREKKERNSNISKEKIMKTSRFLDSSSESDEPIQELKTNKSKFHRLRVLSSSSSSDNECGDVITKPNSSLESISSSSSSVMFSSRNTPSKEDNKSDDSDSEYTPTVQANILHNRKILKHPAVETKSFLSNNNSNAWKNIANVNVKAQQRPLPQQSKVQNLKKMLLSCNMSSVEVHKKVHSKPINVGRIEEKSAKPKSSKLKLNVPNKLKSSQCTIENVSSPSNMDNQNNNEGISNSLSRNNEVMEEKVDVNNSLQNVVDNSVQSETFHGEDSQYNREELNAISVDNHIPTSKRIRHSHYKLKDHSSLHLNNMEAKQEQKNIQIKTLNTENKTLHENEFTSNAPEERFDILGDIMSQMDKNPYRIQKLPSKTVAQPTAEMLGWNPLSNSFAGQIAYNSHINSHIPGKENIQLRQNNPSENLTHINIQSPPQAKSYANVSGAIGSSQEKLNLAKNNQTEMNTNKLPISNTTPNNSSNSFDASVQVPRVERGVIIPFYSAQSEEYVSNAQVADVRNHKQDINVPSKKINYDCINVSNTVRNQHNKQYLTERCLRPSADNDEPISNHGISKSSISDCLINPNFNDTDQSQNALSIEKHSYSQSKGEVLGIHVKEGFYKSSVQKSNDGALMKAKNNAPEKISSSYKRKSDSIKRKCQNTNPKGNDTEYSSHKRVKKIMDNSNKIKFTDKHSVDQNAVSKSHNFENKDSSHVIARTDKNINDSEHSSSVRLNVIEEKTGIPMDKKTCSKERMLLKYSQNSDNIQESCTKIDQSTSNNLDERITIGPFNVEGKKGNAERKNEFKVKNDKETEKSKGIRIRIRGSVYRLPGSGSDGVPNKSQNANSNEGPKKSICLSTKNSSELKEKELSGKENITNLSNIKESLPNITINRSATKNSINISNSINHSNNYSNDSSCSNGSSSETTTRTSEFGNTNIGATSFCKQETGVQQNNVLKSSDILKSDLTNTEEDNKPSIEGLMFQSDLSNSETLDTLNTNTIDLNVITKQASDNAKSDPKTKNIINVGRIRVRSLKELGAVNDSHFPENALSHTTSASSTDASGPCELRKTTAQSELIPSNITQQNQRGSETIVNKINVSPTVQPMPSNLDTLFNISKFKESNNQKSEAKINSSFCSNKTSKPTNSGVVEKHKSNADVSKNLVSGQSINQRNEVRKIPTPVVVSKAVKSNANELKLIQFQLANKDTENLFFQICDNLFTDLLYCKIPKLVDDLHLLILYDSIREERLKKISQLSSIETIVSEKRRIEKEFSDHIKVRSHSFVPLFITIVNKINKSDFRSLVIAVYCRIIQHLERVDSTNANYRFKVRFIIKNMLDKVIKSNGKEGYEDLNAIFGQSDSDFLPTFVFIENLLQKYDRYVEERQKVASETLVNDEDKSCTENLSSINGINLPSTSSSSATNENSNSSLVLTNSNETSQTKTNTMVGITTKNNAKGSLDVVTDENTPSSTKPKSPTPVIGNLDQMLLFKVSPIKRVNS